LPGLLLALPAAAQPAGTTLAADIARAERDLKVLDGEVIQLAQSGLSPAEASSLDRRFSAIERELQRLTGEIERLGYVQRQLADRMDRFQSDVEYRLATLEGGSPGAPAGGQGNLPASGQLGTAPQQQGSLPATGQGGEGQPQVLGSVSAQDLASIRGFNEEQNAGGQGSLSLQQPGTGQTTTSAQPQASAQSQYNYAFGLLRQADYQAAEQALKAFVRDYPNDPLAANAKYWLGETYYVRGDYQQATQAFAQSYQDHPVGPKAPDSLLKLGLSLSILGETQKACQVLQELETRMGSSAKANIIDRARRERANLGC